MEVFYKFIVSNAIGILYTILIVSLLFINYRIKNIYEQYLQDKIKKENADITCRAIQQLYSHLTGTEKLKKATDNLRTILKEKGIFTSNLELRILIESSVYAFKGKNTKKTTKSTQNK